MSFTESQLVAQLDPVGSGRTITLATFNPNTGVTTSIFAVGVLAPYAGRSRWVDVAQTNTPAQAAAVIQGVLQT